MIKGKISNNLDSLLLNIIGVIVLGLFAMFCLVPFIMLISGSFSSEEKILVEGYSLLPKGFSIDAYKVLFKMPGVVLNSYLITIFVSGAGTFASLFLISMTAYVLYRKDFHYRNILTFFFYFTTLFSGGIISFYIVMIRYLNLKNNILALILPGMLNVFYLLMMRNFISNSIPDSLVESSKIDGAGDFLIYIKIIFPLMKPALASIGLFIVLGYWNDWSNAMLFISNEKLFPLQYVLYRIQMSAVNIPPEALKSGVVNIKMPKETIKLAMTVVSIGPIICAYPFVQKYFVKGITIGAVKG